MSSGIQNIYCLSAKETQLEAGADTNLLTRLNFGVQTFRLAQRVVIYSLFMQWPANSIIEALSSYFLTKLQIEIF